MNAVWDYINVAGWGGDPFTWFVRTLIIATLELIVIFLLVYRSLKKH